MKYLVARWRGLSEDNKIFTVSGVLIGIGLIWFGLYSYFDSYDYRSARQKAVFNACKIANPVNECDKADSPRKCRRAVMDLCMDEEGYKTRSSSSYGRNDMFESWSEWKEKG